MVEFGLLVGLGAASLISNQPPSLELGLEKGEIMANESANNLVFQWQNKLGNYT